MFHYHHHHHHHFLLVDNALSREVIDAGDRPGVESLKK